MSDDPPVPDRRRPTVRALRQPTEPVTVHARVGDREVAEPGEVVSLTDRTMVVEVSDPTVALACSLASEILVVVDLGGGARTIVAEPGRRSSDNPTSRRVELVLRQVGDAGP